MDTFVSLAAVDLASPDDPWNATEGNTLVWRGSVIVHADNSVELISHNVSQASVPHLAIPSFAAGGGSYISFPWTAGKSMMYGQNGVHDAIGVEYVAVDFVGGDDMGSGVASPNIFAAVGGTVEWVCTGDVNTAIEAYNSSTDDHVLYAHLVDNANLVGSHVFAKGDLIGVLKYGTFSDDCGYATQAANHYHLHMEVIPSSSNTYRIENCVLNTVTQKWTCGTTSVSPGQFLRGGVGGSRCGLEDCGTMVAQPSFWDSFLGGIITIFDRAIVQNMPSHNAMQFTYVIYNTVKLTLRIARVMVYSNINLGHLMAVLFFALSIKALLSVAEFIVFLFKMWKSLVPIIGA